jgi:glyoxylase-like metal-dependent hydrolase (beta-lactamase superfamily II)
MRVHHLNCATMCPPLGIVGTMVCHCLAIETAGGIVLVDTGLGTRDVTTPHARLSTPFVVMTRPRCDPSETALAQLARLGFSARDVRHIVLTHLDLDHAGGLADFPEAEVHVGAAELEAALAPRTLNERRRYRQAQWSHGPRWRTHAAGGEPWHGFDGVRALDGLPPEILSVPLHGHTRGHHGIAVRRDTGWMLHAGDAYFFHGEVEPRRRCPPVLRAFQRAMDVDGVARVTNQTRLRALANDAAAQVRVFCAHDPHDLARCQAAR